MPHQYDPLIGNDQIKKYLTQILEKEAVPNSLLFSGIDGIGKGLFAEAFARKLLQTTKKHPPDLRHYHPVGKLGMHSIDSLRELTREVFLSPFEAKKKVFIVHEAHRMLATSANALLKTFEEPALNAVVILLSAHPEQMLPTILSRCQKLRFLPIPTDAIVDFLEKEKQVSPEEAQRIAHLARGSIGQACRLLEEGENALSKTLFAALACGDLSSYTGIHNFAQSVHKKIESIIKEEEGGVREELTKQFPSKMTAIQRDALEKEVEGCLSMRKGIEAQSLFDALLCWHRDLHLLHIGGDESLLMNPDFKEKMAVRLKEGSLVPLEKLQKCVEDAKVKLQRSIPLNYCLENLFLSL